MGKKIVFKDEHGVYRAKDADTGVIYDLANVQKELEAQHGGLDKWVKDYKTEPKYSFLDTLAQDIPVGTKIGPFTQLAKPAAPKPATPKPVEYKPPVSSIDTPRLSMEQIAQKLKTLSDNDAAANTAIATESANKETAKQDADNQERAASEDATGKAMMAEQKKAVEHAKEFNSKLSMQQYLDTMKQIQDERRGATRLAGSLKGLNEASALMGTTAGHYMMGQMPRVVGNEGLDDAVKAKDQELDDVSSLQAADPNSALSKSLRDTIKVAMPSMTVPDSASYATLSKIFPSLAQMSVANAKSDIALGIANRRNDVEKTKHLRNERDNLAKSITNAGPTSRIGKINSANDAVAKIEELLSNPNVSSESWGFLKTMIPRATGEVGNLTDPERTTSMGVIGAPGWIEKVDAFFTGGYSDSKRDQLLATMAIVKKANEKARNKAINEMFNPFVERYKNMMMNEYGTDDIEAIKNEERKRLGIPQSINEIPEEKIKVKRKSDNKLGSILSKDFNPDIYEKI